MDKRVFSRSIAKRSLRMDHVIPRWRRRCQPKALYAQLKHLLSAGSLPGRRSVLISIVESLHDSYTEN